MNKGKSIQNSRQISADELSLEDQAKAEQERSENFLGTFGSGVEEAIDRENEELHKEAGATGEKVKSSDKPNGSRTQLGNGDKPTGKTDMKGDKMEQSSPRKPDSAEDKGKGKSCCSGH
jgi:hypothetical protein